MATKITVTYDKVEYVLGYTRNSVKQMEQQGFVLEQISEKPMTMVPLLVYGAFMQYNKGIKRSLVDEIYAETVNTLTDNNPADEGNRAVWKVTKG